MSDAPRAKILLRSLERRFERLGTLFVVAPDRDLGAVGSALGGTALELQLVPETELVPEIRCWRGLGGWYRQQLVKLAISERVKTPFYLTFDADVICTRRVDPGQLLPQGRAPLYVIPEALHQDWYEGSERTLGLPVRRGVLHAVTPAVLATEGVRELTRHLDGRARTVRGRGPLRTAKWLMALATSKLLRVPIEPWRLYLAASAPWTEYALYYSFLESTGRLERYHYLADRCIYDIEGSIWKKDAPKFAELGAGVPFAGDGPPYFMIVQSNSGLSAAEVGAKFAEFL